MLKWRKVELQPGPPIEEEVECLTLGKQSMFWTHTVFFYRSVGLCLRLLNPET
jgi:hypothetical protein